MRVIRPITDRDAWNAMVQRFPGADVRQSWEWAEIRGGQGRGWRPVRLAAFDGEQCVAAVAALARGIPGLGVVAYAARGPLMDPADERAWAVLPALVRAAGEACSAVFLRASPGLPDERFDLAARLRDAGFRRLPDFWTLWNTPRNVMRLPLEGTERDLLGRMARKRRQHISTAAKKGIAVEHATGLDALRRFYDLLTDHAARFRYPIRPWPYYQALHAAFAPRGDFALVNGRVNGELVAALLGIRFGATAYALSAPSSAVARGTAVGDVVHWEWMRWARAAGCAEVDFGSSGRRTPPAPTDPDGGIYRFKVEIGCRPFLAMAYHDFVFEPGRWRLARLLEQAIAARARFWLDRLPAGVRLRLAQRVA